MSISILRAACLVAVLGGFSASTAMAQGQCPETPIRYDVRHAGENRFEISAEFTHTAGTFDISWREAAGTDDGPVDFVSGFELRGADGQWRTPAYQGQGTWQAASADVTALRYILTADHDRAVWDIGKEEIAYRFDDAFYFTGSNAFIGDYGWSECAFEVAFDIPGDWMTVAPWRSDDGSLFSVPDLYHLMRNIFVTGPGLQPHSARFSGMDVVILEQESLRGDADTFEALLTDSVGRYVDLFGSAPVDRYLVVFGEDSASDGGAFAQSFGQRMPAPLRPAEKLMWARLLAHEALHAWLGIAIHPESGSDLQWLTEGSTDYLTGKTLFRAGQISADDMIFIIEGQVRRFFLGRISSGPISLAEAGVEKQRNRQLVYGGGALFSLFLDAHMAETRGAGSYERLLRDLYENSEEAYSFDRMMAALDAASDGEASEIYTFLNGPFNHNAVMARLASHGLATSAFGPDEILVRYTANGCSGFREAACMPDYLAR